MYDPYAEFTKFVLPNGLEVHYLFWDRPWIGMDIVVHSGGREDPVTIPGVAHFVEHLISQNIPHLELQQVNEYFEICGGRLDLGGTDYLKTRYKFAVPADLSIFREALGIFGSMIFQERLEKEIERERKVILCEFNERYPFLEKLEWDMTARKVLFSGHRLETWNRTIGRPEGILSATKEDFQAYYDKHYVPANVSLVMIGGLPTEVVLHELEQSPFGTQKSGSRNSLTPPLKELPPATKYRREIRMSDHFSFKVDQSSYFASWAFPADFPRQALRIFNQVLDKILFSEIRERRGLAYSIGTEYVGFQDVREYKVRGNIHPGATPDIEELVRKCISQVSASRNLFEQKLKADLQRCLMLDLSGSALADNSADDLVTDQRIIPMQEVWDGLHQVRFEQMSEAVALLGEERQYTFITQP